MYGEEVSRVDSSKPDTVHSSQVGIVDIKSHVVPSLNTTDVFSVLRSNPVPAIIKISPPSWLRPVDGVMLVTDKPTLIFATEYSIGIRPDKSVTLTSHEPAAADYVREHVISVDVAVTVPHSELASLTLTSDVGRFVPIIVKMSP